MFLKRLVYPPKCFPDLSDSELALLIVKQVRGTAKGALDILGINDIVGSTLWTWRVRRRKTSIPTKLSTAASSASTRSPRST